MAASALTLQAAALLTRMGGDRAERGAPWRKHARLAEVSAVLKKLGADLVLRFLWTLTLAPGCRVRATASRLNSSLYFLRFARTLLLARNGPFPKCPR